MMLPAGLLGNTAVYLIKVVFAVLAASQNAVIMFHSSPLDPFEFPKPWGVGTESHSGKPSLARMLAAISLSDIRSISSTDIAIRAAPSAW